MMIVVSALASCRDELCYNHFRTVGVSLSWEYEWERDYGMNYFADWDASLYGFEYDQLRPGDPEWVNLIRFSADGARHDNFLKSGGGPVKVDEGTDQSFLLYNGDTEYIILSNIASLPNAQASATGRSRSSLDFVSGLYPSARTTNPPDVLYAAYVPAIPEVGLHETKPLAVLMQPLVYTYVVRYEFEYGLEHVALARGALGGMAESVYLLDGRTSDESSIILYDCDLKDYGCEAHVRSFGVPDFPGEFYGRTADTGAPEPLYTLNLEVRLKNGKYVEFNYDVSNQIAYQPRGGVITVSGLRIEDGMSASNSGFDVGVDDWGDRVDIDLPVNPDR